MQINKEVKNKVKEINYEKEELEKTIAYELETRGKFRISDYDRETVNKHSTKTKQFEKHYCMK